MTEPTRRRWIVDLETNSPRPTGTGTRSTTPEDDPALARVLDAAYAESFDGVPAAGHRSMLETWRVVDHADDVASAVVEMDGVIAAVSLVGRELGGPLLYDLGVVPDHRGAGLGRAVVSASMTALAARDSQCGAWISVGNVASESLLGSLGFVPTTPPLSPEDGLTLFRAAAATRHVDREPGDVVWVGGWDVERPQLWLVGTHEARAAVVVDVGATLVDVHRVAAGDAHLGRIAGRSTPLSGARLHRQKSPENLV